MDLAVISPGPSNGSIACSTGVPFVVIAVLGQARYLKTSWWVLLVFWQVLLPTAITLLIIRTLTWAWEGEPPHVEPAEQEMVPVGAAAGEDEAGAGAGPSAAATSIGQEAHLGPAGTAAAGHPVAGTASMRAPLSRALRRRSSTL